MTQALHLSLVSSSLLLSLRDGLFRTICCGVFDLVRLSLLRTVILEKSNLGLVFLALLFVLLFGCRLFASIYDIHHASEAGPLQLSADNNTPSLFADSFIAAILSQPPDGCEVDNIPRCTAADGFSGLATDYYTTTTSGCANQAGRVTDEVPFGSRICQQGLAVCDFEANAALDSLGNSLEFEVVTQALGEVEGDQIAISGAAGMLKGLLVDGTQGEDVVIVRQGA